jgi:hypothetical protein
MVVHSRGETALAVAPCIALAAVATIGAREAAPSLRRISAVVS